MMNKVAVAFFTFSVALACAAGNAKAGKAIYDRSCKNCHGAEGAGNPNVAKMMKVEMKPLSSAEIQGMSDAQIEEVIEKGKGKMPPVHSVSAAQAADVVAYIRTFKK
jgi:mono/diheme cytochrome c family protein